MNSGCRNNLFLHQLHDLFFNFGVVELTPANGSVAYLALLVDEVCCWKAADAVAVGDFAVLVKQDGKCWINVQLAGVGEYMVAVFHLVNGDNGKVFTIQLLVQPFHRWHFTPAGRAPGGPEVQQHNLAMKVLEAVFLFIHVFQGKVGRRYRFWYWRQVVAEFWLDIPGGVRA